MKGIDLNGNPLLPDLAQFYVAGQMAREGEVRHIYEPHIVWHRINEELHRDQGSGTNFYYPPFVPWLCVPLSFLPYAPTAWIYFVLSLLLGLGLGWRIPQAWAASRPDAREACGLFVASVPFWRDVLYGQNALISLTLLWAFYEAWRHRKHFLAGVILALGAYKPQLFVGAWFWIFLFGSLSSWLGLMVGLGALGLLGSVVGLGLWPEWIAAMSRLQDVPNSHARMLSMHNAFTLVSPQNSWSGIECLLWLLFSVIWLWALVALRMRPFNEANRDLSMAVALLGWGLLTPRLYQYDLLIFYPLLVGWWAWIQSQSQGTRGKWIGWLSLVVACFYMTDLAGRLKLPILTLLAAGLFGSVCYNILRLNIKRN